MACEVFANNMTVACKAADGKAICAFPDVCFTPPQTPATPPGVPIPYPNTGMASDTSDGSKSVKVGGQEVMLKNKSYFKQSMGDEAGCAPKKGMLTSKNMGKVYFNAWSMNVKFEGENVVRNLDLTTHNHASVPSNTGPWPYIDSVAVPDDHPCSGDAKKEKDACQEYKPHGDKDACDATQPIVAKPSRSKSSPEPSALADRTATNECLAARRCFLQQYDSEKTKCCYPQTPHHLVEASALFEKGRGGTGCVPLSGVNTGTEKYDENKAPCVCAEGCTQNVGTHGLMHTFQSAASAQCSGAALALSDGRKMDPNTKATTYGAAKKNGVAAMKKVFPESGCSEACVEAQLDAYHNQCGVNDSTPVKAVVTGDSSPEAVAGAEREIQLRSTRVQDERLAQMGVVSFA